jgi:adenylylsulfate kinase-like enzyme
MNTFNQVGNTLNGKVIWITGLSGSGKTTVGIRLAEVLRSRNLPIVFLDGDDLRAVLNKDKIGNLNHSRNERLQLSLIYSRLSKIISENGVHVVIATISLFSEIHQWNRENILNYFEIFLDVPLEILEDRDPKSIYANFKQGKIKNVAGLDLEIDFPKHPNLWIKINSDSTVEEIVDMIIEGVC